MTTRGATFTVGLAAAALLLGTAVPSVCAGTAEDPELTDPTGDAEHFEFKNQEPALDVEKIWLAWDPAGALQVTVQIPGADGFGPGATVDPSDEATFYDVYLNASGEAYTVRTNVSQDGEPVFSAGQALEIQRQAVWPDYATGNIHGNLTPVDGTAETGEPARITMMVPGSVFGGLSAGDVVEDLGFSTYVDHHTPPQPNAEQHHPGHVDENDEPGRDFVIPGGQPEGASGGGEAEEDTVPTLPLAVLLGILAVLALRRRP